MNPTDTWGDFEKKIADAFYEKWKDELDDVNYLDGIMFTLDYLKMKGLFDYEKYEKYWEETRRLAIETHRSINDDKI